MKLRLAFLFSLLFAPIILAGQTATSYYAESFRRGPTQIKEEKTEVRLTSQDPIYQERVRDSSGAERYELAILPRIGTGEGNDKITSWQVSLRDLRHPFYGNVIQFDQELSENPKDNLYWLNPINTAPVPIRARRIIKVDAFYVSFQVKDFRFTPAYSPYLEYMTLDLSCSNRDPRTATQ